MSFDPKPHPLRELWPFKAAKIMAVMRLVRGYRRPYLLLGSGIWANISSRLCPEGTGSIAPPPPSLHREAAWPPSSQAAPSLDFSSHLVRFTPSSGRAAPRQSAPSLYLLVSSHPVSHAHPGAPTLHRSTYLVSFSPIIPNSQKTGKPCTPTSTALTFTLAISFTAPTGQLLPARGVRVEIWDDANPSEQCPPRPPATLTPTPVLLQPLLRPRPSCRPSFQPHGLRPPPHVPS
jgi:hypothetical protein